eukprot:TRINITY_DN6292_c0_g1_i1.p1 TRINITY_DN6292_c0_g1~~TRINITY_DN6292_c0_g1_i1.p1  ORF type:complete len:878 (+),score=192.13 TRINITY_DN6292_c0_g1_i1:110-2635(+)
MQGGEAGPDWAQRIGSAEAAARGCIDCSEELERQVVDVLRPPGLQPSSPGAEENVQVAESPSSAAACSFSANGSRLWERRQSTAPGQLRNRRQTQPADASLVPSVQPPAPASPPPGGLDAPGGLPGQDRGEPSPPAGTAQIPSPPAPAPAAADADPLLAWAAGARRKKVQPMSPSVKSVLSAVTAGPKPKFGMLGWDERIRHYGMRGKLPRKGLLPPSEALRPTDGEAWPEVTLTQPTPRRLEVREVKRSDSSSSISVDELLIQVASRARRRKQRLRRAATAVSSSSSSNSSASSTSCSSSSASSSSSESSGSDCAPEGGGADYMDDSYNPSPPTMPTAAPNTSFDTVPGLVASQEQGFDGIAIYPPPSGNSPESPMASPPQPAAPPLRRASTVRQRPPPLASSGLVASPPSVAPSMHRRGSNQSQGTPPLHPGGPPGIPSPANQRRSGQLLAAPSPAGACGRMSSPHSYRGSSVGGLFPSVQSGVSTLCFTGDSLSTADVLGMSRSHVMSLAASQQAAMPPALKQRRRRSSTGTGISIPQPNRAARASGGRPYRALKALAVIRPNAAALSALRKVASVSQLRRLRRPRTAADFTPGRKVKHERRGWGTVSDVNPDRGTITVTFASGEVRAFRGSRFKGARAQPDAQLPRRLVDFAPGTQVMHQRRGLGLVTAVDVHTVTVCFAIEEEGSQTYGELALRRGKVQPLPEPFGSPLCSGPAAMFGSIDRAGRTRRPPMEGEDAAPDGAADGARTDHFLSPRAPLLGPRVTLADLGEEYLQDSPGSPPRVRFPAAAQAAGVAQEESVHSKLSRTNTYTTTAELGSTFATTWAEAAVTPVVHASA